MITTDGKGLVCLIGENSGSNANYYGQPESLTAEIEKLKLSIGHAQELLSYKDQIIRQKDNEIDALQRLLDALQK